MRRSFDSCVDASAFDAIQFRLDGDLGDCNIAFAATSSENVSPTDDPRGACTLESCFPPASAVTSSGIVRVHFAELSGGSPGIIDPASLIGVQWQMSAPDGGACSADFSIDDVTFVTSGVPDSPMSAARCAQRAARRWCSKSMGSLTGATCGAYEASLRMQCSGQAVPQIRRVLFRQDTLDVITTRSVSAHPLDALDGPPRGLVSLPRAF